MQYENPPPVSRADADAVLSAALRGEPTGFDPNGVLVALALHDDDLTFVEGWCVKLAERAPDPWQRGLACLCIGHLARRFGFVSDRAEALVRAMAEDPGAVAVNGQVLDARDDLDLYLRRS